MLDANRTYTTKEVRDAVHAQLAHGDLPAVGLAQFLTSNSFAAAEKTFRSGWKKEAIPDRHSFSTHRKTKENVLLKKFVQQMIGRSTLLSENLQFSHGDYTILHDEEKAVPGFAAYLFLDDFDASWGGRLVFMRNGQTLGEFTPQKNTLLIVRKKRGVRMFAKYVNCNAKGSFRMLSA